MERILLAEIPALFAHISEVMSAHADELCEMDAKMGDGDLGLTMKKGFGALPGLLSAQDEPDLGKRLMQTGMKMASIVPSTMGTLMASGIMTGGKALLGKTELDAAGFAGYLDGYAAGIQKRGKCAPGDRTVLDAIAPAAKAARQLLLSRADASLVDVAQTALAAAEKGVEATREMRPKYGKAAAFANRALGVKDQGAYAAYLMLLGCAEYICGKA